MNSLKYNFKYIFEALFGATVHHLKSASSFQGHWCSHQAVPVRGAGYTLDRLHVHHRLLGAVNKQI